MDSLRAELDRTGVTMETVQSRYQIKEPGAMSAELYGRVNVCSETDKINGGGISREDREKESTKWRIKNI